MYHYLFILLTTINTVYATMSIAHINKPYTPVYSDSSMKQILTHVEQYPKIYLLHHENNNAEKQYISVNGVRGWIKTSNFSSFSIQEQDTFERRRAIWKYLQKFPSEDINL